MADELTATVLEQQVGDLVWSVEVTLRPNGEVITMLTRSRGRHRATSGFGGPALLVDGMPNYWFGERDGLPTFVMVRTAPETIKAAVTDVAGGRYEIDLTEPDERFGLRFGAVPLPDDAVLSGLEFLDNNGKTTSIAPRGRR